MSSIWESCCPPFGSKVDGADSESSIAEQTRRSKKIDEMLAKDKRLIRKQVKLLLLGAGESGKSTFLKQMKIIHGQSLIDDTNTVEEYKEVIYSNIIKGMKVLIDARLKLDIDWGREANATHADYVFAFDNRLNITDHIFRQYADTIRQLWTDEGIRHAFDRRIEFQLSDGVRYLFDNIERIGTEGYVPTNSDILHSRKATKGITEYCVTINKIPFRFVDVGGQRSQRQKWFQCFESVTSILFIVSSSEYDQVLLEDRQKNRLQESQNIFDTIVNNRCFSEVSYILFLNKTDLLEEKLKLVKLLIQNTDNRSSRRHRCESVNGANSNTNSMNMELLHENQNKLMNSNNYNCVTNQAIDYYFSDFTGDPTDLLTVQSFILHLFECVRRDKRKQMYHHFTTAVDTENIKYVFNAVRNTILQNNIKQLMLQ
ncbi:guanine nucleotide-binding protein subunit alpha-13-like [Oppia nitens]|uniref:guanine nucleotide-binding protein subunit alpha-13-like n=1 Tax=Oppia nitens TaxID=1686743 RepID=UPI0023DC10FB|nr:guanine nucleotide-binding protein subunit alpha-13-like [Oppia nitens]